MAAAAGTLRTPARQAAESGQEEGGCGHVRLKPGALSPRSFAVATWNPSARLQRRMKAER